MLPAMNITEPYSPTPRANASAKPVRMAGARPGSKHAVNRLPARCAERRRGLLHLAVDLLHHRLHRAHDEGQSDENQRNYDADGGKGDLHAKQFEELADPAVRRVKRGERDAGDGGGEREGKVYHRVQNALAGKIIAHQHPGDDDAEDDIDAGRRRRLCRRRR